MSKQKIPLWHKIVGVFLIIVGFLALVTPFTPGSWLALIGLELIGWREKTTTQFINWWKNKK